jgi:hypothetical protein
MFTTDESKWPVLTVRWQPPHGADDMRAFLAWQLATIKEAQQRGERVAYVHLAVDSTMIDAPTRRVVAEWRAANPTAYNTMIGNWVVTNNVFATRTLTALGWVFPEARRVHLVPTLDEAVRAANATLAAAPLVVGDGWHAGITTGTGHRLR